jgi:hypothetical protein
MKTLKTSIAIALAATIAGSATSAAWAAKAFHEDRSSKTYLPGEGGCKDDSGQGWVTFGCGD